MNLNKLAIAAMLLGAAVAKPLSAHEEHAHEHHPAASFPSQPVTLTNPVLLDQDGRRLRLASDAVGDKIVVVTFVYTHCADTCPTVSHTFSQVQEKLGSLMDDKVRLISITIDPARDTPARLKDYGALFETKPGWLWLTGDAASVKQALQSFGVQNASPENHPSIVVVGDARSGRWTRLHDIENPQQVISRVNELLAAAPASRQHATHMSH